MIQDTATVASQVNSVVDHLAEKLHVPVEKLFTVMVHGAKAQGAVDLVRGIIGVFAAIAWAVLLSRLMKKFDADPKGAETDGLAGFLLGFVIISGLGTVIWFAASVISYIPDGVKALVAPDYVALQNIMEFVKR